MNFIKKNIVVILAFMLPILLIIGLAVSVYLPGAFLSTQYDFVYATCGDGDGRYSDSYNCEKYLNQLYKVEKGKLVVQKVLEDGRTSRLFLHETESNVSREITLDQAKSLELRSLLTSPDGVTVDSGYNYNDVEFFPFFGRSSRYGYYLSKGDKHRQLNLIFGDDYYGSNNFKFIGWKEKDLSELNLKGI
ncbi:MAG: hypothetical protein V1704_03750 [Candidatus Vogelbacteria bacterium]